MLDFAVYEMEAEQAECAARVRELWAAHAPLEQEAHALRGGIIWKKARGHEYLFRYFQDQLTGTKRFESRGRRSAETEAEHASYLTRRQKLQEKLAVSAERVEKVGRIAQAFRLARAPAALAEIVHGLWLEGCFDDGMRVSGAVAMLGYELEGEFLSPAALHRGEGLTLIVDGTIDDKLADFVTRLATAADRGFSTVGREQHRLTLAGGRGGRIELLSSTAVAEVLAGSGMTQARRTLILEAFTLPTWIGVAVARDARVFPVHAIDPRTLAVISLGLARVEEDGRRSDVLAKRGELAAWAARERLGLPFEDALAEAFPELVDPDREAPPPRSRAISRH